MRDELDRLARVGGTAEDASRLAAAAGAGDVDAAAGLAGLWLHVAASAPHLVVAVYDGTCAGWTGTVPSAPTVAPEGTALSIPEAFWSDFWDLVADPTTGGDAGEITVRTAALAGAVDPAPRGGDRVRIARLPRQQMWHRSIDDLRSELGVAASASPFPADLIEQLTAAS